MSSCRALKTCPLSGCSLAAIQEIVPNLSRNHQRCPTGLWRSNMVIQQLVGLCNWIPCQLCSGPFPECERFTEVNVQLLPTLSAASTVAAWAFAAMWFQTETLGNPCRTIQSVNLLSRPSQNSPSLSNCLLCRQWSGPHGNPLVLAPVVQRSPTIPMLDLRLLHINGSMVTVVDESLSASDPLAGPHQPRSNSCLPGCGSRGWPKWLCGCGSSPGGFPMNRNLLSDSGPTEPETDTHISLSGLLRGRIVHMSNSLGGLASTLADNKNLSLSSVSLSTWGQTEMPRPLARLTTRTLT